MENHSNELIIPATLTGFASKVDRTFSIRINTQELTSEEKTTLLSLPGTFGWLAFKPNPITADDIPKEQAEQKDKTPSRRLRAALYVLATQRGIKDFEAYYVETMEKIINRVKNELDQ